MISKFSAVLIMLCSLSSFAQVDSVEKMAADVKQLVEKNAGQLNTEDQLQVRKNLKQIIQVFKLNGFEVGSSKNFTCVSTNNQLIDLETGSMIHDFVSMDVCSEALANVKIGKSFCDFTDNTLYRADGKLIFDLVSADNCRDAVNSIAKVKKFCDYTNNTLRKADGTLIFDFISKDECVANLK